jgi:hypothetical protein
MTAKRRLPAVPFAQKAVIRRRLGERVKATRSGRLPKQVAATASTRRARPFCPLPCIDMGAEPQEFRLHRQSTGTGRSIASKDWLAWLKIGGAAQRAAIGVKSLTATNRHFHSRNANGQKSAARNPEPRFSLASIAARFYGDSAAAGYSPTAAQFMEFATFHRGERRNLPTAPNDAL